MIRMLLILACAIVATPVTAAVIDRSEHGFVIEHHLTSNQSGEQVYAAVVQQVDQWWDPAHTYSGDAANLSIDDQPGGCFCERWSGGAVQHLQVVYAQPGKQLRLLGGLGPLQAEAVNGSMTWTITNSEEGVRLDLVYRVSGYRPGGLAGWADPVDQVLSEQVGRLDQFLRPATE
ncbi:MAG: SRPBCC family protein [Wenzhouxiangellaceae bacterium]